MPQRPALSDDRLSDDTVKHDPLPDETVRMRADGPAPDGGPSVSSAPPVDDHRRNSPCRSTLPSPTTR